MKIWTIWTRKSKRVTSVEQITSVKNNRVKEWASLKQKKLRNQTGLYIAEGVRLVEEVLESGAKVQAVLISGDLQSGRFDRVVNAATSTETQIYEVNDMIIEHIADTKTPQGVIAIVHRTEGDPQAFIAGKEKPLDLVLDSIQDPGNLGTMIRTADAVGATGVFIGHTCVDLYNPKVVRATMGSLYHLPVFEVNLDTGWTDNLSFLNTDELDEQHPRYLGGSVDRIVFQIKEYGVDNDPVALRAYNRASATLDTLPVANHILASSALRAPQTELDP